MKLDDICVNYVVAASQRVTEMVNSTDPSRTIDYKNKGCYICKGVKNKCGNNIKLGEGCIQKMLLEIEPITTRSLVHQVMFCGLKNINNLNFYS